MSVSKKTISLLLSFTLIFPYTVIADVVENYDSGRARIENIMADKEMGIGAYNKEHIKYAETQNLSADLNIPEIAKFFNCKTVIGASYLTETLKMPVNPQDKDTILAARQNAIKTLVENPALKKEVEQLLETAKHAEQDVVKLMSEFFMGQNCPELANLELIKKQNPGLYPFFNFLITNPTGKVISTVSSITSLGGIAYTTHLVGKLTYTIAQAGGDYTGWAAYTAYMAFVTGLLGYQNYKDYSMALQKRSKMHALNKLISIAEKFEKLCADNAIHNQFNISAIKDSQGVELIEGLKKSRYKNEKSYAFLTPMVHTFLYKLYQNDKHLAHVFACIAEMDAYNAIATKILESRNKQNKFCFATFRDTTKPMINAQAFWNVLVVNAVPSSISETKHIILTGPNAGGKSTAIRALLQNIVLAQSFGVAAALSFEFTIFDVIHSYLNISDDLINGLSLFASEVKRAQEIVQKIKALGANKKFFFALDELFTGTNAEDGETCAYEFVKRISAFDGVQFIYATHFNKLKELGTNTAVCINYKVDAPTKNNDGKLVYPYTLSQGMNEARVALDLAREANLFN